MAKRAGDGDSDVQASVPASTNLGDEYLQLIDPVLEIEKLEEPLPEFDSYKQEFYTSSPVNQLDEGTDDAVKVQISSEDKLDQVVDELGSNSLLDRLQEQEFVPEEIVTVSSGHQVLGQQQEIDKLKEKLEVSLSSLKEVEQELLDSQLRHEQELKSLNVSHTAEMEKVHEQHRMVVEKLADETSAQPPMDIDITAQSQQLSQQLDRDEIEMERLKLIKESLKENYEKEKESLKENYEREKEKLIKENQEKMELFKQQMEINANDQLQQYHEQYRAAYDEQTKQKAEAEAALLQTLDAKELEYREKLSQFQRRIDKLEEMLSQANEEKRLEVAALSKSHSDELHSMQRGKQELESDLKEQIGQWKSKAANLEHLLNSTSENTTSVDTEFIEQLKTDYEEKLAVVIQEKSQLESQLLSQINALNEELSKEKQQQELSSKEKDTEIHQLTAELERVNQILQSKEKATANASREIEEIKRQHEASTESIEQLKTDYEEKLAVVIQEKTQLESQLLSQINALNEKLSKEKQQEESSTKEKDSEIRQLTAELERVNQMLQSKETTVTSTSREIEEIKRQHEDTLEKVQLSLTQAHKEELAATQKELQTLSNQLQVLSNQEAELNESKRDAISQLEKTQLQLHNAQISLAQSKEEKQRLINDVKKYQNQIHNLEVDLSAAQKTNTQDNANFERDISSYKTQISQLQTTLNEFQSRELLLQTELQALQEQKASENDGVISTQDMLFTELDAEVLRKAENLTSSSFTSSLELIKKLLVTLESKASEVMLLQESNKQLVSQTSELQVNVSEDTPSTTEVDLLRAYEQLQVSYEELKDSSNIELENLKHEKQTLQDVHEEQLREKEKTISTLQKQLQTSNLVSVELQNEFGRECTRYESEKQSLEQAMKEKTAAKDALDNIVSVQAKEIEQKFEKERQALIAKINEKETLEAELTTRKIELGKRLTEKTKLEEVLAEKSRLEQELRAQKSELERELFEIETKLKSRESEIQQERSDWSMKLNQKDSTIQLAQDKLQKQDELFLQKERQLKESHDQEVHKLLTDIEHSNLKTKEIVDNLKTTHAEELSTLQNEMDEKNSLALSEMETRLNKSHQEELGNLKEKHSVEVI